ncbi:unnamed protein product [Diamesa serratosioi]
MEEILDDTVSPEELEKFEKEYRRELEEKKFVTVKTQFEYAWSLIRSRYASDIHTGISLFEDLSEKNPEDKRDYIYYLAIANTRVKKFEIAQKFVKAFLELEPTNQQVLLLDEYIEKQLNKEFKKDAAITGGALLVFGGLLGLGFALAKK